MADMWRLPARVAVVTAVPVMIVGVLWVRSYGGPYSDRDQIGGQTAAGTWSLVSAYGDMRWRFQDAPLPPPPQTRSVLGSSDVHHPIPGVIWADDCDVYVAPPPTAPIRRRVARTVVVSDALLVAAWRTRKAWLHHLRRDAGQTVDFYLDYAAREDVASFVFKLKFRVRSAWLLGLFSGVILLFFSLSTNQEYYTFPAWPPLLILIAAILAGMEEGTPAQGTPPDSAPLLSTRWLSWAHGIFAVIGLLAAVALAWGLWQARALPYQPDIGTLLAHRGVGDYTLSMSHLFDLTGASFAALRLPAVLALITLLVGPLAGWLLRVRKRHTAATVSLALTAAVFLVAAHIAFARFEPMLSSKPLADTIVAKGSAADTFIVYGDQSDASSVIFYTHKLLHKPADIVMQPCSPTGEGSSLLWGSCYPDAPKIFLSDETLSQAWGTGERKWLFAQDTNVDKVESLLHGRLYEVQTIADKVLWTDRPLSK